MKSSPGHQIHALIVLIAITAILTASPTAATTRRAAMGEGLIATLTDDQELYLESKPQRGEGLITFSRRLTGSSRSSREIARFNNNPRRLVLGVRYKVPYKILRPDLKLQVIRALFPRDSAAAKGWIHQIPDGGAQHSLWRLSEWLTGRGQNFTAIRELNQLNDNTLPPGGSVVVPPELLQPIFLAQLPKPPPSPPPANADYTYERGAAGEFLVYRLKRGEALYSKVVMRFNGSTFAKYVNAVAAEIAELNKIRDVRDIAIGEAIRVPFDLLLPEYLPPEDPRRREYEKNRSESAKYSNTVRTSTLEGITVILDAGHGGQDPGAVPGNVWESSYVYDVMLRTRQILESQTAAHVVPTTRDGATFKIHDKDKLPRSKGHKVLTDPPYPIVDTTAGTHLRWYLANSIHRRAVKNSGDPQKTLFISIHADSLHPSVRGAMVYVPDAGLTKGKYQKREAVYTKRREVREQPSVSYSWQQRVQSEGLSRQLAKSLLDSFRRHNLLVKAEKPIRDRVIRCRGCSPWVPAVVRRNAVPAKLLLEVSNLNNKEERRLLQTRAYRQRLAEAIVDGILAYYGQSVTPGAVARR